MIITTNLERDDLAEQINERTVSRLEEMCLVLPVGGRDLRRQTFDSDDPPAPATAEGTGRGRWLSDADRAWEAADPDEPPAYGRPRAHRLD